MVAYCAHKFSLNEDTTTIEFNHFNGVENYIYPTLSVCFTGRGIFDVSKIEDETKSDGQYKKFLNGELWDEKFLNVNYENVSLDAKNMLENLVLQSSN